MLPAILSKIGLPVFVQILSGVLAQINNPAAQGAAEALGKVDDAIKGGQITQEQVIEANRHTEKMTEMEMQNLQSAAAQVNETIRIEAASTDPYVRRMRPTFGYMIALTWAAQMLAVAYVITFETEKTAFVVNAMADLGAIWAVGLSVLGIYVFKRSEEKKAKGPEVIGWNTPKAS